MKSYNTFKIAEDLISTKRSLHFFIEPNKSYKHTNVTVYIIHLIKYINNV